ncbi:TIGR01212 family radical SAM protein [Anaerofustis sp. NSJ-163]|uniref:TIGR01212 family radical SAM protein n=1 Tax=Anaerofustis sp. NSJ-163 TaxID=2944391 RepID=UPI00209C0D0A|nr:TIGR01212 family radical SAM protein [Anaerofustis sp. NSJ-163]MCO8193854.1 TIGR01212 family radical SAM protein [Anaerofustis sp. NSJ-163]
MKENIKIKWEDKPYYSFNCMLKERFNRKVYKVSINAGMTCPNRDGKIDTRGCIFCSRGGSGDFAGKSKESIQTQIDKQIKIMQNKSNVSDFIAYFQAYTNTYAPLEYLKQVFYEAINHPNIVALSIATRPDCLDDNIIELISSLNKIKPVWIELGLQTIHEKTAEYIRRGYDLKCFEKAVNKLRKENIDVIVHTILGLPGENRKDIIDTIEYLNKKDIQGIKLQLLHVLKNTDLAKDYIENKFKVYTMDEYIDMVIDCIEHLRKDIVIHRITGDGPKKILIAPLWSGNKKKVLNTLHHEFKIREAYQGKKYNKN